ncbi:MAG: BREX system P-loop protein BrxC [Coriobacteriia bacterium]|nr:BREX system P-loop protein BrxC [Coriobacteriia bacterium]
MRIQQMFERDIDRDINGVVKVAQEDDSAVEQELSEYVITRELAGHFASFYGSYERALDVPTDKVGVWISGFFGSGKSHFLKMLSYLLTNQEVRGRRALDYFDGRFEDPMVAAQAARCAAVPTQSILFNVDNKAVGEKDKDVLKRTFARVFYDALGFYGEDLKLARLEKFIDDRGRTQAFRDAFARINGEPWLDARPQYDFFSDDVIDALEEADVMSRDEAERWLAGTDGADLSIQALTDQIRDYAEAQAAAHGGQFRLLFMADEIGQFIGGDVNLMLNLQTIVEELGTKCAGRVWVMVTSQEDIDSVVKVAGNDFSKIQGRFNTRLSLSSSSADEVIKRRVLAKNPEATGLLLAQYAETAPVLRNLFTFEKSAGDLIGYDDADDFAQTFPFAGYQFKLMQNVMGQIRRHGSSGKHLSSGERSMLSGFQEAAQRVEEKDENAIVPFWMFYDTLQTFLEGHVRRVVDRAAQAAAHGGQGLEPQDVDVLKLLFLLKWEDGVKTTVGNVATLVCDDVRADRLALREQVQASLDRLVHENYVGRNGEEYVFLTDDEQEVARQIARTEVDAARITKKIADVFYGDIFPGAKLTVGENNFPVGEWLDETRVNQAAGLTLRVMTALSDEAALDRTALLMRSNSSTAPEAIVVLSDEVDYYDCLHEAARIEAYTRTVNLAALPKATQDIIKGKNQERAELEKKACALIEEAVRRGAFYAAGEEVHPTSGQSARKLVEECLGRLVACVYPKLDCIDRNYHTDAELRAILNGSEQAIPGQQPNARALDEVERWLDIQARQQVSVTMAAVQEHCRTAPFGWREIDIAAVMAELISQGRVKARLAGMAVDARNPKLVDCLRKANEAKKLQVERRVHVSEGKRGRAREAVVELCGVSDVPGEEDALARRSFELLSKRAEGLQRLLDTEYRAVRYPGHAEVEAALSLIKKLLAAGTDPADLLPAIADACDDVLDAAEDLEQVEGFFKGQRQLFDTAWQLRESLNEERDYLAGDDASMNNLQLIREVLGLPRPYKRIKELGAACQELREAYDALLKARKPEMLDRVRDMYADIKGYADAEKVSLPEISQRELQRRDAVNKTSSLKDLDAIKAKLDTDQGEFYRKVDAEVDRRNAAQAPTRRVAPAVVPHVNSAAASGSIQAGAAPKPAQTAPAQPAPAKPRVKKVQRATLCPPKRLRSQAEVDAYLDSVRAKLVAALAGADAVQID